MRKVLLAFALVLVSIASNAQKGMSSLGMDAEVAAYPGGAYGFDIKYQYNLFNMGRIEPSFSMSFGKTTAQDYHNAYPFSGTSAYRLGLHYHQFLNGVKRNRFYVMLGGGYEVVSGTDIDYTFNNGNFEEIHYEESFHGGFVRTGVGYERKLSHKFSLQTEVGLMYSGAASDFVLQFKIGATYNL